jgi:GTP cyclohydrolase I
MTKKIKAPSTSLNKSSKKQALPSTTHFPSPFVKNRNKLTDEEKVDLIADHFKGIMDILGLDLTDNSLSATPYRIAKMYVKEVFSGMDEKNFPSISFFEDTFDREAHRNMVFSKVGFTSFCEHHFVPMTGSVYVAYLPKNKFIGLSKIPRIVRFFARRPQLQERLTAQIADCIAILMDSEDVAVSICAEHFCVLARGIQDEHSHTITNVLRGQFDTNAELRREFFESINRNKT